MTVTAIVLPVDAITLVPGGRPVHVVIQDQDGAVIPSRLYDDDEPVGVNYTWDTMFLPPGVYGAPPNFVLRKDGYNVHAPGIGVGGWVFVTRATMIDPVTGSVILSPDLTINVSLHP